MAILVDSYDGVDSVGALNNTYKAVSQSFTGAAYKLYSAIFSLQKIGSPTGNVYAKLYAHSGTYGTDSVPTGAALATSTAIAAADVPTSLVEFFFTGANKYQMSAGTKYCIVLDYADGDASNYIWYGRDVSAPTHDGNRAYYSGGAWTADNSRDLRFYVYGSQTYQATLLGTLNMAGTLVKSPTKILTGTLNMAGILVKKPVKMLLGTLSMAGTINRKLTKILTGTLSWVGGAIRTYQITIEGNLLFSGSLTKKPKKLLTGTLTFTGALSAAKYVLYRITSIVIDAGTGIIDKIKARKVKF